MKKKDKKQIANFFYETGILAKTPRSGFHFLGSGQQSVAEHINRVVFIGYSLALSVEKVNLAKVLQMCLLHDLHEGRTSDLNYVHQKYTKTQESKAVGDLVKAIPFGKQFKKILKEYLERKTIEARLAKDADRLEWIISLKEQLDTGNTKAKEWLPSAIKRLDTKVAKELAAEIMKINSDDWWFEDKSDSWWVNRDKKGL
jgi:putative hydrolase of HD superfamily